MLMNPDSVGRCKQNTNTSQHIVIWPLLEDDAFRDSEVQLSLKSDVNCAKVSLAGQFRSWWGLINFQVEQKQVWNINKTVYLI